MRYLVLGFSVFAAACAGASPTAPTSSATTSSMPTISAPTSSSQIGLTKQAEGGSELPFKGSYEGLETVDPVSGHHFLSDVTGNATQLGRFTVTAEWALGATGNFGTSTWTAANGDQFSTTFTRRGDFSVPLTATFTETHDITGGTGRFAKASGTFTVVQTRGLSMPYNNSASIEGTIDLDH